MYDNQMSESRIKKLWRNNRISLQLTGFHLCTSFSDTSTNKKDQQKKKSPPPSTNPTEPLSSSSSPNKKLWRKPLPNDCPQFDFEISEKTIVEDEQEEVLNTPACISSNEIPTRHESRCYENKPFLEAQLERACRNEKAVLLTRLLEKQRNQKPTI
jgi:hypothetical protein